MTGSEDDQIL